MSDRRRIDWASLPVGHVSPPWLWQAFVIAGAGTAGLVAVLHVLSRLVWS